MERQINVFPVAKLGGIHDHEDNNIIVAVEHPDGTEMGFLLPPEIADELTGALIERPKSGFRELGSLEGSHQDVVDHSLEQIEPDAYQLQLSGEDGAILTFRLGTRRLRRIRDAMTAHIVRQERKSGSQ